MNLADYLFCVMSVLVILSILFGKLEGEIFYRPTSDINLPLPSDYESYKIADQIALGKKYYVSFLMLEGQRHRGYELCEVVGFEAAFGDPKYYPIIKEKNGKTYATCRMRLNVKIN